MAEDKVEIEVYRNEAGIVKSLGKGYASKYPVLKEIVDLDLNGNFFVLRTTIGDETTFHTFDNEAYAEEYAEQFVRQHSGAEAL